MTPETKANWTLRRMVMHLVTSRIGWAENTHMQSLLVDIRDDKPLTDRELALTIEWLKMLPTKED